MNPLKKITTVSFEASGNVDRTLLNEVINNFYLGQSNCNYWDQETNTIKEIDHPNIDKVKQLQETLIPNFRVTVLADYYSDGKFGNFRLDLN